MFDIWKVLDGLAEGEDDNLWKTIRKLYGPMMELSLMFPSFRRDGIHITVGVLLFYLAAFPVHMLLLTITIKDCVWEDFDLVSLEFNYWLLMLFAILATCLLWRRRQSFMYIHRVIGTDFMEYRSGRIYAEREPTDFEEDKKKQTIQFLFLPALILSLAGIALLVPYIKNMDGTVHYNAYGANMKLPIPGCYPFPTHAGIVHLLTVFGQLMAASGLAIIISSLDLMFFRLVQAIIFEFRVLCYAIRTIQTRAAILYGQLHPGVDIEHLCFSNQQYQESIGLCLKDCVVHHHKIVRLISEVEYMCSLPAAIAVVVGTGAIGLSLINIVNGLESGNYENVIIFMLLLIGEILSLLVLTYFGEAVISQGLIMRDELWFTDWANLNGRNRKLMLNLQVGITEPPAIKWGGIVVFRLDTFSQIMNTAYSFFNLVISSKKGTTFKD